ncbi:mechanosensitive ion channel domain-containing protein [Floridanema evergladense]|uniref:Mechanosensitive ion channel domain-containing protein n=1 Tax=Floridaenema evergladense BLCC-F167 TaxID=3153639 RepID=A0ABV4WV99_9CYAN
MENLWSNFQEIILNQSKTVGGVELFKIAIVVVILLSSQVFKQIFFSIIVARIEQLTKLTNSKLDDRLIAVIKPPLGWFIFFLTCWVVPLLLTEELGDNLTQTISKFLSFAIIATVSYTIFELAPLLGEVAGKLTVRTETELDDLIVPYLPKLFQIAAVLLVVLKGSEVILGVSATAIVGILGGAGIAFGLLIKDVIYDWCCTVIIYADNLYRKGDKLIVTDSDIDGQVEVLDIGLRSTKLGLIETNSIRKIPNSQMIRGIVENRSQKINAEQLT